MTVQELLNMYRKSELYDVVVEINYCGGGSIYDMYSEIPQDVLEEEIDNFNISAYTNETRLVISLKGGDVFDCNRIGKNTKELFLSKIQGKKPKDIIKIMKEFFSDCIIDVKSDNVKSYASYLYCKENKLI